METSANVYRKYGKDFFLLVFLILWAVDTLATIAFTQRWGLDVESNPLMRALIANYGYAWFAAVKVAAAMLWIAVYRKAHILIGAILVLIMLPITSAGSHMAWGL